MAANPVMVECVKDVWTKVIENKTAGTISKTESDKSEAPFGLFTDLSFDWRFYSNFR
jgi:hypothetical protein